MALSPQELQQVRYLLSDDWVCDTGSTDDDRRTWEQFHAALDPLSAEGLHQFADHFNVETGVEELHRVIRHPRCDLGTALMVFWRLGPGWHFQYERPEFVPSHERKVHTLLTEIQQWVLAEAFPMGEIAIDPRNLDGVDRTQEDEAEGGLARVAPELFAPSPGRVVEPLPL